MIHWSTAITIWCFFSAAATILLILVKGQVYRYIMAGKEQLVPRKDIARDLHDQLGSTLSSIAVYIEVARAYRANGNTERLDDILENINNATSEMLEEMDDMVWALSPKNNSFESILDQVNKYAKPLCCAVGIDFRFHCPSKLLNELVTVEIKKNIYLIIKEAINNAVKYSECQTLNVYINPTLQCLEVRVQDDGCGFELPGSENHDKPPVGNGIQNMRSRSKALNGQLCIRSTKGNGCLVKLLFRKDLKPLEAKLWISEILNFFSLRLLFLPKRRR